MYQYEYVQSTPEYKSLRSSVPQRKVIVDGNIEWSYYDAGPKSIHNPIIFLPPVSGTADIFFRQLLSLSATGCRAIAVNHPVVWDVPTWCQSFHLFLNSLQIDRVHLFGASLGGFLAQKFAEHSGNGRRVRSMILCNAFNDTDVFQQTSTSSSFWAVPAVVLKKLVMGTFDTNQMDGDMIAAADFMVQKLDTLSQQELASRLTLNCVSSYVEPQHVQVLSSDVSLMNVFDHHALSNSVQNEMSKLYPDARKALLKTGGNFPYLSRSDEVNIYIQVHLQRYADTVYSASEPRQFPELSQRPSTAADVLTDSDTDEAVDASDVKVATDNDFNSDNSELQAERASVPNHREPLGQQYEVAAVQVPKTPLQRQQQQSEEFPSQHLGAPIEQHLQMAPVQVPVDPPNAASDTLKE